MKHEELVEEIVEIWSPGVGTAYPDWIRIQRAKATITLVLCAVRDGRLELPGEAWRAQAWIEDGHDAFPHGRVEVRPPIGALKGFPRQQAFDVTAFHPLTGTGKEEEAE